MIRKDYSFLVFNHIGSPIKRLSVSNRLLTASGCIIAAIFIALVFLCADYFSVRKSVGKSTALTKKITQQKDVIDHQREQIQTFAVKINELKSRLTELDDFEKKIRIIANLEESDSESEGLFGIGGSMPEDLDPTIEMKERQIALLQEMHEQVRDLDLAAVSQQERFKTLYGHIEEQRNIIACTPTIRPVDEGYVSSSFGYRTSPFTDRKEFHKGLDIASKQGAPIMATADGVVSFAGKKGLLGNTIVVDHGYGFVTRFGHAHKLLKKRGETVKRGEVIAYVGNTGRSTGPHVHYEVQINGVQVNPKRYIMN
jgi:murein DD-endopeptidase MepM/ murein hydrolase activator NlpD